MPKLPGWAPLAGAMLVHVQLAKSRTRLRPGLLIYAPRRGLLEPSSQLRQGFSHEFGKNLGKNLAETDLAF